MPIPPSILAALAGATVLVNLSASNITIGKADYRHQLVGQQSARCLAAYLYPSAGRRRVDHRPGLGRPGADLRERRPARRIGALRQRRALHRRRRRPRAASRASACGRTPSASRSAGIKARLRALSPRRASTLPVPAGEATRAAPQGRALPLRAGRSGAARRALRRGLQHPGAGAGAAAVGERHREGRDRRLGRARLDPCAAGLRPGDGPARPAAHATSSPTRCPASPPATRTLDQARRLMAAVRLQRQRDRHPAELPADARRHRPSVRRRQGRATTSPSRTCRPASAPATCSGSPTCTRARRRHRRPERAGARLEHLRRRRPHVALQRQRQRAEDADQAPGALGRGQAARSARRGEPGARRDRSPPRSAPSSCPATPASKPAQSIGGRASARTSCRTSTSTTCCATASRRRKVAFLAWTAWHDASGRWPDGPTSSASLHAGRDQEAPAQLPASASSRPASSSARCVPNAPKVGSGGSLSPRGDWRAPSDSEATVWLDELETVPDA